MRTYIVAGWNRQEAATRRFITALVLAIGIYALACVVLNSTVPYHLLHGWNMRGPVSEIVLSDGVLSSLELRGVQKHGRRIRSLSTRNPVLPSQ